jgi:hypothetical protein
MNKSVRKLFSDFKTNNDLFKWEIFTWTAEQILNLMYNGRTLSLKNKFLLITSQILKQIVFIPWQI